MVQAAALRKQGFRSGVSDYFLPVPVKGLWAGLWLELKRQHSSNPSPEQVCFLQDMRDLGYQACWARGAVDAEDCITKYLAETGERVVIGYSNASSGVFHSEWMARRVRVGNGL